MQPSIAVLPEVAERLADLVRARLRQAAAASPDAFRRATRLRDHLDGHVLPRARSLDAPLVVVLVGPTGAGKSSLLNALAGRPASPSGVLRPTTRELVAVVHPADSEAIATGGAPLAVLAGGRLRVIADPAAAPGLALVDAPDVDSVERANRELSDRLAEVADLGIFVTTATRYADRVPWEVLQRARDRGLPLVVVVNRMPPDPVERADVLADLDRLLVAFGVEVTGLAASGGADGASPAEPGTARRPRSGDKRAGAPPGRVGILSIREGALDPERDALAADAVAPLRDQIEALGRSRDARRDLAARALAGSLAGLGPLLDSIADDTEHEAIDADALRRTATEAFDGELRTLREDLGRGTFLRAEALRQWHAFVGADAVTRLFASGIGRVRGTVSAILRGTPRAPVAEVREEAVADLVALARRHAGDAARRVATAWSDAPATRGAVTADPSLWGPSDGLPQRLEARLDAWLEGIAEDVQRTGGPRRTLARGASVGVNAAGIGVMLATFAHTGGLTGAEVGITAATGVLNQKLLEALFGEAALVEMVGRARRALGEALEITFDEELARFHALLPPGDELRDLAVRFRDAAAEARDLRPALPLEATPVLSSATGTRRRGRTRHQ